MTYVEMLVDSVRMDIDNTSRTVRPNGVDGYCIDIDDTHVRSWVVVLREPDSDRTLPITIGRAEAQAIAFKLQESAISRPMPASASPRAPLGDSSPGSSGAMRMRMRMRATRPPGQARRWERRPALPKPGAIESAPASDLCRGPHYPPRLQ